MFKLLDAYFSRLSKWMIFRIMLALMPVAGFGTALLAQSLPSAWNIPYLLAYLMFPHYVGVIIGLFNYPMFTNGTIRNQLSVGHRRSHIYLADWAASNAFAVALYLGFTVALFITMAICSDAVTAGTNSNIMEGMTDVSADAVVSGRAIVSGVLISTVQIIFFTTVTQLFCVMLKGVKSFLAIYLGNQFLVIASMGFVRLADKFNLPEKLINLFPSVVCMRQSSFSADPDFLPGLLAMIAETAIVYMIGNLYFRKTDIN